MDQARNMSVQLASMDGRGQRRDETKEGNWISGILQAGGGQMELPAVTTCSPLRKGKKLLQRQFRGWLLLDYRCRADFLVSEMAGS